jgi:hypothetical protein
LNSSVKTTDFKSVDEARIHTCRQNTMGFSPW